MILLNLKPAYIEKKGGGFISLNPPSLDLNQLLLTTSDAFCFI